MVDRVPAFQPGGPGSIPDGPGSIPDGFRNFNSYPGIGCVTFVFCPVMSLAEALTLSWPYIQGGSPLCICLMFRSIDICSPYKHLTHGHLGCKSLGVYVLDWGRVNKRRRSFYNERKKMNCMELFWIHSVYSISLNSHGVA